MKIETRYLPTTEIRIEGGDDSPGILSGYAATFNDLSLDLGGFREFLRPGAFTRTLAENDIRALYNHDTSAVLGRTKSGTLRLVENDRGLSFQLDLPNTQLARDLMESVRRGDIDGCSFGFQVRQDQWNDVEGTPTRELIDLDLHEISIVAYPAYPSTEVALRGLAEWQRKSVGQVVHLNYAKNLLRLLDI
jgi:HK97 family phage prohead protease